MNSLLTLLSDLAVAWSEMHLVDRWMVASLIIGSPSVYIYETVRYWRLRKAKDTLHLAPIAIKGKLIQRLAASGITLALRSELLGISIILKSLYGSRPAPYIAPATSRGSGYYIVGLRQDLPIPVQLRQQKIPAIEHEIVIEIGSVRLPVTDMMNYLVAMLGAMPVYGRRRYKRSQIHLELVALEGQVQLTLHVPAYRPRNPTSDLDEQSTKPKPVILTEIKPAKSLEELRDILRDAAFMILQLHGSFGQRSWRSMRYLLDGMEALDETRRTGHNDSIQLARECFRRAAHEDPFNNFEALYFHGNMTMVDRTAESIDEAILCFKRALHTPHNQLKALVNAGLTYCYAQRVHRLGKLDQAVLDQAIEYAAEAKARWQDHLTKHYVDINEQQPMMHPLLPYTEALVLMVNLKDEPDQNGMGRNQRFWHAAKLCRQAISLEPSNDIFYNNLGWTLLKLVEWGQMHLPKGVIIDEEETEKRTAVLSELQFKRSISLNPNNKLSYANLCLLYSTEWFREMDRDRYLTRCRYYGRKALKLHPEYINGHRDLALALVRYGEFDEAYTYFSNALKLSDDPDKKEEIISDVAGELGRLQDVAELLTNSQHKFEDWKYPNGELLEPN